QMSTKSTLIEDNNKESVDKDKEKAKSFTDKIVNKISHIGDIRGIEIVVDPSSNVKFITFGLFVLIGFIVLIYAILVTVVVVVVVADRVIQSANVFFVVTIISISTLFGTLVYQIRQSK
ncbi:MAG: hypothetical protein ACXW0J_04830, partial [Nitrososphaeraceae archaeon]